jgi:hypothetical protein
LNYAITPSDETINDKLDKKGLSWYNSSDLQFKSDGDATTGVYSGFNTG